MLEFGIYRVDCKIERSDVSRHFGDADRHFFID